jgi:hypothetical protein
MLPMSTPSKPRRPTVLLLGTRISSSTRHSTSPGPRKDEHVAAYIESYAHFRQPLDGVFLAGAE